MDLVTPYIGNFGSKLNYQQIQECQPVKHKDVVHEISDIHHNKLDNLPTMEVKSFVKSADGCFINGHLAIASDPKNSVSVLEAVDGGCQTKTRRKVSTASVNGQCQVAVNAGYFNTHTGQCYGKNVIFFI